MNGQELPRRRDIKKQRLHKRVGRLCAETLERYPAGFAPKLEQIGCRHPVMKQQRRADADAGKLQWLCRTGLKPKPRPGFAQSHKNVLRQTQQPYGSGHRMPLNILIVKKPESIRFLPLRKSSRVNFCS